MKLTVVAIAAAVVGSTLLARSDATANDPVVELPKFVVTDSRELPPPEFWRYGTMPGFEILSNASDKATQRLLRDFDMFRQALGYIATSSTASSPPTVTSRAPGSSVCF